MRVHGPYASIFLLALTLGACAGDAEAPSADGPADAPEPAAAPAPEPAATPGEAAPAEAPPKFLAAAHILVQWNGAMRAKPSITRTKAEAMARAGEVLVELNGGGDFAALAKEYSDGPSGPTGGDLGTFPAGRMIPQFTAALMKGKVGEVIPEPVESAFGYHLILRNEVKTLGARHILVQYQGSMRAKPTITRSKEEAETRANEALAKAKAGGDFAALAGEYSDGPTSTRGGDLGTFPAGAMHPDFETGLVSVAPGTLVDALVETPFGYHLIFRTE